MNKIAVTDAPARSAGTSGAAEQLVRSLCSGRWVDTWGRVGDTQTAAVLPYNVSKMSNGDTVHHRCRHTSTNRYPVMKQMAQWSLEALCVKGNKPQVSVGYVWALVFPRAPCESLRVWGNWDTAVSEDTSVCVCLCATMRVYAYLWTPLCEPCVYVCVRRCQLHKRACTAGAARSPWMVSLWGSSSS